jgi:ParB family chromosome partitioning protein
MLVFYFFVLYNMVKQYGRFVMDENPNNYETEYVIGVRRKGQLNNKAPNVSIIALNDLVPFKNHPFEVYDKEDQRFIGMVESIRANGLFQPIIVRPHPEKEEKYEILSGHNRVNASRKAGRENIHAIIRKGLSDEEALLIVTETNLIQRSFADMKHSERAIALASQYETMKMKPGYRSDLLQEIAELTRSPLGVRLKTGDKLGAQYGLKKTTVARYLRVNKLITPLKKRLDIDEIGMRVAEALSYLRNEEQEIVENLLADGKKICIKQADLLKEESEKGELNKIFIEQVIKPKSILTEVKPLKLRGKFLSKFFKASQGEKEIEEVIANALEQYFSNQS